MKISISKKFAVLGNPVAHSLSPEIHQAFAIQAGLKLEYTRMLVPLNGLKTALQQFQDAGGYGVNITLPFKSEAVQLVHQCTERAIQAEAVNTITFNNKQLLGDNTDGVGLVRDLTQNLGIDLNRKHLLILGAGGAARGILAPLLATNPASIVIANRTLAAAQKLAANFSKAGSVVACDLNQLLKQSFQLIINATAAGLTGQPLQLPTYLFKNAVCYDLAYGAAAQHFLGQAKQADANSCYDGLGMLVEQAAEAFYSWHQIRPDSKSVIESLKKSVIN